MPKRDNDWNRYIGGRSPEAFYRTAKTPDTHKRPPGRPTAFPPLCHRREFTFLTTPRGKIPDRWNNDMVRKRTLIACDPLMNLYIGIQKIGR